MLQPRIAISLFLALAGPGWPFSQAAEPLEVTAPPESFFELVRERDRDAARAFYAKHIDIGGLSAAASAQVDDRALLRTHEIVSRLLAGRPDIVEAIRADGNYLIIIGKDQVYTDMPEYRNHPNPEYQNERVRGTGGKPTSFGEENLLSLPLDRYDDESIAVHEFCHTIDGALRSLDPDWNDRKEAVYRAAMDKGLWTNAYAASNPGEYWAEICQSYFDCNRVNNWNHGPAGTREQLSAYDPTGYELVRNTFRLEAEQDWRYTFAQPLPNVVPPPSRFALDPWYTKFTWAREFTVAGRGASDEALLQANDVVRKMFAYRHDLLKALIAAGVKLVVLGREECLADLPEIRALRDVSSFDLLLRSLDCGDPANLLVVAEENLSADPAAPNSGDCQVIRVLAQAVHRVAGTRPVDPAWEDRPRRLWQQYELRVQRLDERFDQRLQELHNAAIDSGKWKGTSAIHDRVSYWASGVLAYFHGKGQDSAPADAPHPIVSREQLKSYDSGLYELVHETFAYEGRVDWRLLP